MVKDITLPTAGPDGVAISWASTKTGTISTTGVVTTPFNGSNVSVTLTATLTKSSVTRTKTFELTVISRNFAWSQVTTSGSTWGVRQEHAALSFNNKIWVLGGEVGSNKYKNDVWSSSDGATWTEVTGSAGWSARRGHAAVVFGGKMWVLGGDDGSDKNDVWWSADGATWTNANARGPMAGDPHWSAREDHAAVVFDNKMWVMGGRSNLNDVWWSSDGTTWTNANARGPVRDPDANPVTYRSHWSNRFDHTVVVFDNKMWVMGGFGGGEWNDVWSSSDGENWTRLTHIRDGAEWPIRNDHAAVVFDNKMWIMGGSGRANNRKAILSDVWWSTNGSDWTNTNASEHWTNRDAHAAVVLNEKIFLMGGCKDAFSNEDCRLKDVWVYQQTN